MWYIRMLHLRWASQWFISFSINFSRICFNGRMVSFDLKLTWLSSFLKVCTWVICCVAICCGSAGLSVLVEICEDWFPKYGNVVHVGKQWTHYGYLVAIKNCDISQHKFQLRSECFEQVWGIFSCLKRVPVWASFNAWPVIEIALLWSLIIVCSSFKESCHNTRL